MRILFITRLFYPHIGGVEKHVMEVSRVLLDKGNEVTVLTEKYDKNLKSKEKVNGIKIIRFDYPHVKFLGLVKIWWQMFKLKNLINSFDVIHIHDVFIWYLPLTIVNMSKFLVTTIHGLEWNNPQSFIGVIQKIGASKISNRIVGVGIFLKKYLKIDFNLYTYGGVAIVKSVLSKSKEKIMYLGRLESNTGLLNFLRWAGKNKKYKIDFVGDGELKSECKKYGKVHGFCDPTPFLKKAEYCVPGGYLAALEALAYGCKLKLYWNNKVKEDYWKMSPFYKLKGKKLIEWAKSQTWEKLANEYIDLYNHI